MRIIILLILAAVFASAFLSLAPARDNGQWAQSDPQTQHWFRTQKSPKTGILCCNESDGTYVEEDIRAGQYWMRGGPFEQWTIVPDDVVIRDANRNGSPVVWWRWADGLPEIYCFAPGGGV